LPDRTLDLPADPRNSSGSSTFSKPVRIPLDDRPLVEIGRGDDADAVSSGDRQHQSAHQHPHM
jgi:hypothetical protein